MKTGNKEAGIWKTHRIYGDRPADQPGRSPPEERIKNFNEFHIPLHCDEQQAQGARCMDCGVPLLESGMMIGGMASGCP